MKFEVTVGNVRTQITRYEQFDDLDWFEDFLSVEDEASKFVQVAGRVKHIGKGKPIRLFCYNTQSFPTGLLRHVVRHAKSENIEIDVIDKRERLITTQHTLDWLRPIQTKAVEIAVRKMNGILWMPTGSGKTEVAIAISEKLQGKWLFLVHKKDLLHQTAERYERRTNKTASKIGDGVFDVSQNFVVATFQTLSARIKKRDEDALALLRSVDGIMVDECHTLPANSFWSIAMNCQSAYRFGLSGTPLARSDKKSIYAISALGGIIYRIRPQQLIEAGLLAQPIIHMPQVFQECNRPTWQGVYGEMIVKSAKRNKLIVELARKAEKPCLIFVKQVNHGKALEKRLRKAGIPSEFIWGDKNTSARQSATRRLVHGDTDVLIASNIFQEGIDIPELRSLIIATAGRSAIAAIQRIGRGMRLDKDKTVFHVWDIYDTGNRIAEKWSKSRHRIYEREGYDVVLEK